MYTTQFMTRKSRRSQTWLTGRRFDRLPAAQLDCAIRRIIDPRVRYAQVLDEVGRVVYLCDNLWAAFYDLAIWEKQPDPARTADRAVIKLLAERAVQARNPRELERLIRRAGNELNRALYAAFLARATALAQAVKK